MSLHKIYNFVGYNNLGLILEQERKHWLLKPDKKLNVQDSVTGSIFVGRLDNLGNEVIVESNKTDNSKTICSMLYLNHYHHHCHITTH